MGPAVIRLSTIMMWFTIKGIVEATMVDIIMAGIMVIVVDTTDDTMDTVKNTLEPWLSLSIQ